MSELTDALAWAAKGPGHPKIDTLADAARKYAALTEQERSVMGQDDDGRPNGKDYVERRMVGMWITEDE